MVICTSGAKSLKGGSVSKIRNKRVRIGNLIKLGWRLMIGAAFVVFVGTPGVHGQSSPNYFIEVDVISGEGGGGSSTNYDLNGVIGQPSAVGNSSSSNYDLEAGYPYVWLGLIPIANLSVTPTAFDFGNVTVQKKKKASFWIQNSGNASISIASAITGADASMFTTKTVSKTIKPGKTLTIKVTFKPTSAGPKSATLEITSNDPVTPVIDIPLSGTGQ